MKFGMRIGSALGAPLALYRPLAKGLTLAMGLTLIMGSAQMAQAQTPPAQPPASGQPPATGQAPAAAAQPATPAKEESTFTAPSGLLLVQIKPDKTAAYETMLTKLKDALAKSEKPERRAMAKGWKVYKASEQAQGNVLYVHVIEASAAGDYSNPLLIINEVFPTEAQGIYAAVKDGFVQTSRLNLTLVQDLSGAAGAASAASPAPASQAPPAAAPKP
jgi:hypothetical protein